MPKISEVLGISIYIYWREHGPSCGASGDRRATTSRSIGSRIVNVEARSNYRVWIRFEDGTEGVVDLSDLAGRGVFERWEDPGEFDKVYIDEDAGKIAWPGGLNVAPDRLYRDLKPLSTPRTRSG